MNTCEEVFSGRIHTPYHYDSPFAEARGLYLANPLARGWARATVNGTACKLAAFAARVDINCEGGVTVAQIPAAADDWMKEPGHYFRSDNGPHRARIRLVNVAPDWLRFLDRLREPEGAPVAYADLLAEFCDF